MRRRWGRSCGRGAAPSEAAAVDEEFLAVAVERRRRAASWVGVGLATDQCCLLPLQPQAGTHQCCLPAGRRAR
uniref:cDNA clone:002-129-D08, full insert sequence n=1 Tax=Oryza sativa subsp. japonica TaxID=39947 RepID=Q2R202_ORYSJ|nr:hypothetical protein LOC_Os11g37480 [Oryza sativa Japonica Group]BAG98065.1 unnamed protein product [Oryza sativa Japonica Group]